MFLNKPVILNLCEGFSCHEHVSMPDISEQSSLKPEIKQVDYIWVEPPLTDISGSLGRC